VYAPLQRDRRLAAEASVDGSIRLSWRFEAETIVVTTDLTSPPDFYYAHALTFTARLCIEKAPQVEVALV
jgi:hypothetical protein